MKPTSQLPAVRTELPPAFRYAVVRNELDHIAEQATHQNEVNAHARDAAYDILVATNQTTLPEDARELYELFHHLCGDTKDERIDLLSKINLILQEENKPDIPDIGVDQTHISRDVLRTLHPDHSGNDAAATDTYKTITRARVANDTQTEQGAYAALLATATTETTAENLELRRYRAWTALNASKGRFSSHDQVDIWKERQLQAIPYRVRGTIVTQMVAIMAKTLGERNGTLRLSGTYAEDIVDVVHEIQGWAIQLAEAASANTLTVNTQAFDDALPQTIEGIVPLIEDLSRYGRTSNLTALVFGDMLRNLCNTLPPQQTRRPIDLKPGWLQHTLDSPPR